MVSNVGIRNQASRLAWDYVQQCKRKGFIITDEKLDAVIEQLSRMYADESLREAFAEAFKAQVVAGEALNTGARLD